MKTVTDRIQLKNRKALVTGGLGHIGSAICQSLSELGAEISILDLESDKSKPGPHHFFPCDLSNEKQAKDQLKQATEKMKGLDVLVHCAAFVGTTNMEGWAVPFEQQTVEAWKKAMDVNLTSAFTLSQASREALSSSGRGSIIFISSIYGLVGPDLSLYDKTKMANPAAYNASKGGILQLTRYLATVLAPQVRVNAISPGGVKRDQPKSFLDKYVSRTPLKRMASEEDITGAVAFLASDLSSYVTGQNLVVDGGWTAW